MTSTLGIKKIQHPNGTNIATLDSSGSITFDGAITGTLATAAQTNITSVGTLTSFRSTGIDDNADATAITIDAGESVFIGNTAEFVDGTGTGDKGIQLNPLGLTISTRNGGVSGIFGRQASDGEIIQFRKNGSAIGSIGVHSGTDYFIGSGDTGIRFSPSNNCFIPYNTSGLASRDAGIDLGISSVRFKDLYLSGGLKVGGTGTANTLDDYEEGTFTPNFIGSGDNYGATHTFRFGQYTKIGDTVYFTLRCASSSVNSTSDQVYISGLPFAANYGNSGISDGFAVVGNGMKIDFGVGYVYGNMTNTNSVITLLMQGYNVGSGAGIDNFRQHDMYASHDVRISGFYKTTS